MRNHHHSLVWAPDSGSPEWGFVPNYHFALSHIINIIPHEVHDVTKVFSTSASVPGEQRGWYGHSLRKYTSANKHNTDNERTTKFTITRTQTRNETKTKTFQSVWYSAGELIEGISTGLIAHELLPRARHLTCRHKLCSLNGIWSLPFYVMWKPAQRKHTLSNSYQTKPPFKLAHPQLSERPVGIPTEQPPPKFCIPVG